MSSVGQAIGYIGGAIIGAFFGYPMLGAAIGGMIAWSWVSKEIEDRERADRDAREHEAAHKGDEP